jgi:phenylacetic acid degradation operon negative regulatory protein
VELTARRLILDLLTTVRVGAMPVRALVEAGELFGFAANNVRVSLSKLYAEGRVARDERGRYRLGPAEAALSQQLRNWRRLEEEQAEWSGGWVAAHAAAGGGRGARARRERALAQLGFRELERGLALRPDSLRGGVEAVRARFAALVAPEGAAALIFGVHSLDPSAEVRARSLWDADALAAGYRAWIDRLAASRERLAGLETEAAMVETFVVGAGAVRHLHLDPLLPAAILDPAPRRALVTATRAYDDLGRRLWADFLARHDVPNFGSPHAWRAPLAEVPEATLEEVSLDA